MKKVLVSGYIGFDNFGDEAIFYALSSHLKDKNFKVSVLCNNSLNVAQKYGVETFRYKNIFDILKAIISCDVLISGGGSLLQNKTSNFSLFYYLLIILFAKLFFKKVVIFAQGIEPINGKFPTFVTKNILKLVDFVSVRDKKSLEYLKTFNINSILVSDPAYSLAQDNKINENKTGLIVQLREFKGMNDELIKNLAEVVSRKYQGEINVFSFQDKFDEKICLKFIEELKKNNVQANYISQKSIKETLEVLNNAKYLISTRLHGLIIGNALKTSCFALCYDEKVKTLKEELNLQSIDINNYTKEELDNKLDAFFNHCLNEVHQYRRFEWDVIDNVLNK